MKENFEGNAISLPTAFSERMKKQLGEDWIDFLASCSLPPKRGIRLNLQRIEGNLEFSMETWIKEWKLEELSFEKQKVNHYHFLYLHKIILYKEEKEVLFLILKLFYYQVLKIL